MGSWLCVGGLGCWKVVCLSCWLGAWVVRCLGVWVIGLFGWEFGDGAVG